MSRPILGGYASCAHCSKRLRALTPFDGIARLLIHEAWAHCIAENAGNRTEGGQ